MAPTTDFGFEQIDSSDKARRVAGVFSRAAGHYDLMNDLMSAGLHRLWKRHLVELMQPQASDQVLDVASGSADLALLLLKRTPKVLISDINQAMLQLGCDKLLDHGHVPRALLADAQQLPLPSACCDHISVGFGLRNMTDKQQALQEFYRVLKPGGSLWVLEFSRIAEPLQGVYRSYLLEALPRLGRYVAADEASYAYLGQSILKHPDQSELAEMFYLAGFDSVRWHDLMLGAVAIHHGTKASADTSAAAAEA